jgi:hypothetical protein
MDPYPTKKLTPSQRSAMESIVGGLPTKSAKIRALSEAGFETARIAEFLGLRYQHVRNVLGSRPAASPAPSIDGPAPPPPAFGACIVEDDGRLSLPAVVLAALAARPGDALAWRFSDDELVLMGASAGLRFAQDLASSRAAPGRSWMEELRSDRTAEVAREEAREGHG